MAIIKLAVRELVEFTLRSGDIKATFLSSKRAVDGTKAHTKYQNIMKKQLEDLYAAEVSINYEYPYGDDRVILSGRIDGIDYSEGVCIDEIKSTNQSLDQIHIPYEMHIAQAKLYAYMIAVEQSIELIEYRLIYIQLDTGVDKRFDYSTTKKELEVYFGQVIELYMSFYHKILEFENIAKVAIEKAVFPFGDYRKGQKALMRRVYETIERKEILFGKAPTGIGKTIGTLFPALKAVGHDKTDKIFYLTAKTIGKKVASDTLNALMNQGVDLKYIVITAKEKSCINDQFSCNPEDCPYAKGHYDRINGALSDIYDNCSAFNFEEISEYAKKHIVCPYEFSLDLALFSMVVICDYNYAFDPQAMLRRFFVEGSGRYSVLIDEAHNLVDRGRDMYSAQLDKTKVLDIRRLVKTIDSVLYTLLGKLNQNMLNKRKALDEVTEGKMVEKDSPEEMGYLIRRINSRIEKIFVLHQKWTYMNLLLEFYFELLAFFKIMELYGEHYVTYYEKNRSNLKVKLFCLNPGINIQSVLSLLQGAVFFSATLTPMDYYVDLLSNNTGTQKMMLGSPFPKEHLCLLVDDRISTKFADRPASIAPIISDIHSMIESRRGHYIVYFPSYRYMMDVLEVYEPTGEEQLIIQRPGASDVEKEAFIESFHHITGDNKVGFAVMGGMYGEGIDLVGEKLSGVMVVGVGLPQICFERDIIKNYFSAMNNQGFEYAYVYPGMNKVMQSAGRVIRSMSDQGIVLLVDQRFKRAAYQRLFPHEWQHRSYLGYNHHLRQSLELFWQGLNKK